MTDERSAAPDDGARTRRAPALAECGWGPTAPNPPARAGVGRDGSAVGALRAAGERAGGARLSVSREPCNQFGKAPPCTDAILAAGVHRVVAACADPSPVARGGAERLRDAGLEVTLGVEEAAARELN